MNQMDWIERRYLKLLFSFAVATQVFSIALFILLTAFDYIGFDGKTPITPTCSNYFNTKYSQTTMMIEISYISSIIALITFSAVFGVAIHLILKICKTQEDSIFVSKCIKISVVILTTIGLISAIVPAAYYLSFLLELGNCSSTYDSTAVIVILSIAAVLLILYLLFYILFNAFLKCSSNQKYRQVENNSTEPNEYIKNPAEKMESNKRKSDNQEKRTPQQLSQTSPPKKVSANKGEQMELTKQHLYGSPTRQPIAHASSKQIDPRLRKQTKQIDPNPRKQINPHPRKQIHHHPRKQIDPHSRRQMDPHPLLKPVPISQKQNESPKQRGAALEHKASKEYQLPINSGQKPSKEGELIFSTKAKKRGVDDDEQDFAKQQSLFMSKYGSKPILSNSSGVVEANRQKRFINDAFNKQQSPTNSNKYSREKSLLNKIRGKYAN